MIQEKICVVKRVGEHYHKLMNLDPTDGHHQKIQHHINILKNVNIDYWRTREKVVELAKLNLNHAGFKYIIDTLEDFEKNIDNLKDRWVYFTDDDDWVDSNINTVLSEVIRNNREADCIVWPHVRYHSLTNVMTGNKRLDPSYNPTPKLQTNHCILKITDKFLKTWKPDLDIKDKTQHWNLNDYVYESPELNLNVVEIPRYLSLWNNTPISFSWCMHPELFSIECKESLSIRIANYSSFLPMRTDLLVKNNLDTVFLNYIHTQQQFFKR
jgi:hypothetical protein